MPTTTNLHPDVPLPASAMRMGAELIDATNRAVEELRRENAALAERLRAARAERDKACGSVGSEASRPAK